MDFTGEDLTNPVNATVDWIGVRMIEKYNLKRKILLNQIWGSYVLIFIPTVSKYKEFFSCIFFFFFPSSPVFMESLPLYSLPSFDPSLPLVDYVDDLLDACPIRALLETLCVAMRLNTTVQASFPHKCGQLVRYRTFNVVVAAFLSDVSQFTMDSFLWSLSSKVRWSLLGHMWFNDRNICHYFM